VESYIEVEPDTRIWVSSSGSGAPVVFLHAWGTGGSAFHPLVRNLAPYHQLIVVDLRGHGKSDPGGDDCDLETLARDVATVIKGVNAGPVTLVGWSMGAMVATLVAARFPALVNRIVLLGTASPVFAAKDDFTAGLPKEAVDGIASGVRSDLISFNRHVVDLLPCKPLSEADRWFLLSIMDAGDVPTLLALAADLARADLRAEMASLEQPVLIIHGEDDTFCSIEIARWIERHHPRFAVKYLRDCGHAPHLEHPRKVQAILEHFLAGE
jgi:pimeloyl-ACP methyl ester carboxylesterase